MSVDALPISVAENARLADLLIEPRESLNVELKNWLDLSDRDKQALLAKALIALRNHG